MSRITLSELTEIVRGWLPDYKEDRVKTLANLVVRELNRISSSHNMDLFTVTTLAPVTSVTVDATQGSSSVTVASGSFPTTYEGQRIQIDGSDTWYEISDVVADTSFSLSSAFDGDTGTGLTTTIAFPRVELPSTVIRIVSIGAAKRAPLADIIDELEYGKVTSIDTNEPTAYYEISEDNSNEAKEIMLLDFPDDVYTYTVLARVRTSRFTSGSSSVSIPEEYEDAIVSGTLFYALDQERGTNDSAWWSRKFAQVKREMKTHSHPEHGGGVGAIKGRKYLPRYTEPEILTET